MLHRKGVGAFPRQQHMDAFLHYRARQRDRIAGARHSGDRARAAIEETQSSSFSCDLKKWLQIMETYEKGAHVYHTTMPTDSLKILRNVMKETQSLGFAKLKNAQIELGQKTRGLQIGRAHV